MSTPIPPRPKTKNARIRALLKRCQYIRRMMGFNRSQFTVFLNTHFLNKENGVFYGTVVDWENGGNCPTAESALALAAFADWATQRERELGYHHLKIQKEIAKPKP